jgi:hypothetical protein
MKVLTILAWLGLREGYHNVQDNGRSGTTQARYRPTLSAWRLGVWGGGTGAQAHGQLQKMHAVHTLQ